MSGICSKHQHHDPSCDICRMWPRVAKPIVLLDVTPERWKQYTPDGMGNAISHLITELKVYRVMADRWRLEILVRADDVTADDLVTLECKARDIILRYAPAP